MSAKHTGVLGEEVTQSTPLEPFRQQEQLSASLQPGLCRPRGRAQGDTGHPSPAQSRLAPHCPLSSSHPDSAPSRQKPAAVRQPAELSVQAGLRLITGAISWQQGPSRWEIIVTVKKPQGWDTSNQGGKVYSCLEQWCPGGLFCSC